MVGSRKIKCLVLIPALIVLAMTCNLLLDTATRFLTRKSDRTQPIQSNTRTHLQMDTGEKKLRFIVHAYMHTGSTFLGSLLQQRPGTFYEYEPIRSNQRRTKYDQPTMSFLNGSTVSVKNFTEFETEMLLHRLHCDHGRLDIASLSVLYHPLYSDVNRDRRAFMSCQGQTTQNNEDTLSDKQLIEKCLPLLTNNCKKADTIAHKYIRASFEIIEQLLETFPDLKVIYLVRDPRAMMDSQDRKNDMGSDEFQYFKINTEQMCTRMTADLSQFPRIKARFPQRIMMVRHEDLSDYPVYIVQKMFTFLTIPMLDTILSRLRELRPRKPVWRSHISEPNLRTVDNLCEHIYPQLGYIQFSDLSDVRDTSLPAYKPINTDDEEYVPFRP